MCLFARCQMDYWLLWWLFKDALPFLLFLDSETLPFSSFFAAAFRTSWTRLWEVKRCLLYVPFLLPPCRLLMDWPEKGNIKGQLLPCPLAFAWVPSASLSLRKHSPGLRRWFSLPLSESHKTHTHFLSRHNHLIFKPHNALGNGKPDILECQIFKIEFQLIASDIPSTFAFFSQWERHFLHFSNVVDYIYLPSLLSQSCFMYYL